MSASRRAATAAGASLLLAAGLFTAAPSQATESTSSSAKAASTTFAWPSNCTQLNRRYSHGISDRRMTKRQWIRKGATGKGAYRPRLYKRVKANLDRDKDHIACEK